MSSAFPFPVTPRRKRATSGGDVRLCESLRTPIRLSEPQSTPDSHHVPELDWGLTPETADQLPTTPSDKASPSPIPKNASDFSIVPTRPLKQLRRSSRIQADEASKSARIGSTSQNPSTIFPRFVYPVLPSLPSLSGIVKGDISWKNSSFFELSRPQSSNTGSQSTLVAQPIPNPRSLAGLRHAAEPAPKRAKERADPIEEETKPRSAIKGITPTVVGLPEATPEIPVGAKKETYSALTGVARKRFCRILPLETLERIWEDKQRCVASLVTKPDTRCSALAKSPNDVKKWVCSQLSDPGAVSDLMAWEAYVRELIQLTTCTAHHRNIAEEQLERLLDRYHNRRSRHVGDKHDFTQQDLKVVQCWRAALTSLPPKADGEVVQTSQEISFVPRGTPLRPVFEGVLPISQAQLPTSEAETVLIEEVLSLDACVRPHLVHETWNGAIHSCKALPFEQLLSLLNVGSQRTTCIGKRRDGMSCHVSVAKASREKAFGVLRGVLGLPSISTLEEISGLLLCKRFHQAQIALISSQWLQRCTVDYASQKFQKKEIVQANRHRVESTLMCQEKKVSNNFRTIQNPDSFGEDSESDSNTCIAPIRIVGAAQKTETAQMLDKSDEEIKETLNTTTNAILTVEKKKNLTSNSECFKTETVITTRQLMKTTPRYHSPPNDGVKSIQTRSKTVAFRQSLLIAKPASKLDAASLVGIHQKFSWYTPGKSGSTSVENWLHKRLNANLTPQEFERPLKDPGQDLKYPSQAKNYPGQGLIYMYWIPGNFGFVKIGKTSGESTEQRLKRWNKQCGHPIEEYTKRVNGPAMQLHHAYRVEKLVHDELKDYRMKEICCEKCGRGHDEWFAVPQSHALKVIEKWSDWIMTQPYIEARGVWHLKEPIGVDNVLCKPIELPVGHRMVLPALQGRQQTRLKTSRRTSNGRKKST